MQKFARGICFLVILTSMLCRAMNKDQWSIVTHINTAATSRSEYKFKDYIQRSQNATEKTIQHALKNFIDTRYQQQFLTSSLGQYLIDSKIKRIE